MAAHGGNSSAPPLLPPAVHGGDSPAPSSPTGGADLAPPPQTLSAPLGTRRWWWQLEGIRHLSPPSPASSLGFPKPTQRRITKTLERYQHCCYNAQDSNNALSESQSWYHEMSKLKAKFEALQRTQRHLLGEDLGPLSVKELQQLEKQLECALSQARQRKTQLMMEQVEELRRKERQLGEINRQLKHKLEVEGSTSNYRAMQQASWAQGAVVENGATYVQPPPHSAAMDSEPTLQIGYPHQFVPAEANTIQRSTAPAGGENNFMLGWVL